MAKTPIVPEVKAWTLKTLAVSDTGDKTWTVQTFDTKELANEALASINPDMSSVYPTEKQAMMDTYQAKRKGDK